MHSAAGLSYPSYRAMVMFLMFLFRVGGAPLLELLSRYSEPCLDMTVYPHQNV